MGVILVLPDGRSADELDIGRLMSEKQEYVKQDLDNLDKARRKAEAALLAVANGGGDARLRHLFKNPTQTIAKLQNQRTALAALKQELVFGPIKRTILTAALDTAAGWERPEKEPKEPATLLAEKKKEKLAVKGAGLREGGKKTLSAIETPDYSQVLLTRLREAVASLDTTVVVNAGQGVTRSIAGQIAWDLLPTVVSASETRQGRRVQLGQNIMPTATLFMEVGTQIMNLAVQRTDVDTAEVRNLAFSVVRAVTEKLWSEMKELTNDAKQKIFAEANRVVEAMVKEAVRGQNFNKEVGEGIGEFAKSCIFNEVVPLRMARQADIPLEKHTILKDAGFMEYFPVNALDKIGKLVVLTNGHLQSLDESATDVGMNKMTGDLASEGYEVLHFRVGLMGGEVHGCNDPELLYDLQQETLDDRLQQRGMFAKSPRVTAMGQGGYSWGGGTAKRFAEWLASKPEYSTIPVHMALIDAVELGTVNRAHPAGYDRGSSYRPPVDSLFNRYQVNEDPSMMEIFRSAFMIYVSKSLPEKYRNEWIVLEAIWKAYKTGNPAHGKGYAEWEGDDQESLELSEDHFSIDNADRPDYKDGSPEANKFLINEAVEYISQKLK